MGKFTLNLSKYKTTERRAKTKTAALGLNSALKLKKTAKWKINSSISSRTLKAHDTQDKISQLQKHMGSGMKRTFPAKYRAFWDKQDEFVRTSLVTDLLVELDKQKLKTAELDQVKQVIRAFSSFRFPTAWSGFKFKDGSTIGGHSELQHPTSAGKGMWNSSISTFSKAHTLLDEARVKATIDAGVAAVKLKANVQSIAEAMIVAAGTFTLNRFTGPAMASNLAAQGSIQAKTAQTMAREFLKDTLELYGAKRSLKPLNTQNLNHPWQPDQLKEGEVSPRRGAAVTLPQANKAWTLV